MTSKRKRWGLYGLLGLLGLLAMGGAAAAAVPDDEPDDDDDDEPDDDGLGIDPTRVKPPDDDDGLGIDPTRVEPDDDVGRVDVTPVDVRESIVDRYFDPSGTQTGILYQIQSGDNPTTVAMDALGVGTGHPAIVPYIRAMALPLLNFVLYDTIYAAGEGRYGSTPSRYTIMINSARRYIGDAFTPKHANVLADLKAGIPLVRGTDLDGAGVDPARRRGLIWLPRVDAFSDQNEPIISDYNPPDDLGDLIEFA